MADLKALQQKLNADPALQQKFIQDPGKLLADHGVALDDEQLKALKQQIQNKLRGGANPNAISVGITVGN